MSLAQAINQNEGGCAPAKRVCKMINRTGATLTAGDLVAVNVNFVDTYVGLDPRVNADGATGYLFSAACAVTTANRLGVCLVFESGEGGASTCADNATGTFVIHGVCNVNMNGANKGEFLAGTNAQVYATPLTLAELEAQTTNSARCFGIALEDTTSTQVKKAIWNAWGAFGPSGGGDT